MPELDFVTEDTIHEATTGWFREMPEGLLAVQDWLEDLSNVRMTWSF